MPDKAYNQRSGRGARQRQDARDIERATAEFAESAGGQQFAQLQAKLINAEAAIAALAEEVKALKAKDTHLRGEGGIEVRDGVITLRRKREPIPQTFTVDLLEIDMCVLDELTGLPTGDTVTRTVLALVHEEVEPGVTMDLVTGLVV